MQRIKPHNRFHKVILTFLSIIGVLALMAVLLVAALAITEYKPAETEVLSVHRNALNKLTAGDSFNIMTWNIGYGALGETADFFMDGGKSVNTATKKQVKETMSAITDEIRSVNPDILFLQEVDVNSNRSHGFNETTYLAENLPDLQYTFAHNFKVFFIPYPMPPIGKVNGGIMTFSSYQTTSSVRQALPCPFSYFTRIVNLKRCLMINRTAIEGSNKELVLVNLHLEAYDDGEGKTAQTALLRRILQEEAAKGNYVIAGGDFNQSFSNIDTGKYPLQSDDYWHCGNIDTSAFGDSFQFVMDNTSPTCRSLDKAYAGSDKELFQYYLIDGFIVSSNLTINSIETKDLEFKNSDHNPVIMNVTLTK